MYVVDSDKEEGGCSLELHIPPYSLVLSPHAP
jgi:hypothetical protein